MLEKLRFSRKGSPGRIPISVCGRTSTRPPPEANRRSVSCSESMFPTTLCGPTTRTRQSASASGEIAASGLTLQPNRSRTVCVLPCGSKRATCGAIVLAAVFSVGHTSTIRCSCSRRLPFLYKAMSRMKRVRSVTSGSLKVTRSRLRSDVPESKLRGFAGDFPAVWAEKFPGELQLAGCELVVVDGHAAVEFAPL